MSDQERELYDAFMAALSEGATISFTMDEDGLAEEVSGDSDLLLMLLSMLVQRLHDGIPEELIRKAVDLGLSDLDLFDDFEERVVNDA